MIDIHVHLAALPDGQNGCYISPRMLSGPLFRFLCWKLGVDPKKPKEGNRIYLKGLVASLGESRFVQQAVVLGMDGVYDEAGILCKEKTHFLISNDYVFEVCKEHPDLLMPGVSINPKRRDALEELDRCVSRGAKLVKILPNAQAFNPAEAGFVPFWKRMAHHKIPLLCHVGYEFSLTGQDQSVGDPARLVPALEAGVKVIAAHGMSYGLFFREPYFETMLRFAKKYPNFYWDASALSLQNRVGMLLRIRKHPELHSRMVFGTDYPLPQFAYPALLAGHWKGYFELRKIKNPFDRHYRLLQILGFQAPARGPLRNP